MDIDRTPSNAEDNAVSDTPTRHNVKIITLGCAKNEVDSDRMRALIEASPLFDVDDARDADVIIVNTCSFLISAVEEGIELALQLVSDRMEGQVSAPVVMCGCIPSRYGEEIESELSEVAAFVPVEREDEIVKVLADVCGASTDLCQGASSEPQALRTVRSATAYLKISDGCDRFCSFCAIPYIRGRYYSRPAEVILKEAQSLVDGGVREIVLIGQDTGIWGTDLPGGHDLAWLMRQVAAVLAPVNGWLRVLYLQPEGLADDLIEVIRNVPEVVPYIDIPLQHCSSETLARMNRTGDAREFSALIDRLRAEIPDITLRTTMIAGFPGETDEEFDDLVAFVEQSEFDYMAVFSYSQEEGTAAAEMEDQVDEDIKMERTQRLQDLADIYGFASAQRHVGNVYRVLVDATEEDEDGNVEVIGRTRFQAPDSDGVVHLGQADVAMGDFVDVLIEEAVCYELFGTVLATSSDV